jgi:hypothetical protein
MSKYTQFSCRKFFWRVCTQRAILYNRIVDDETIDLLTFWNTAQDPGKLKVKARRFHPSQRNAQRLRTRLKVTS